MSPKPTSPIQRAWFKWKSLRLPWRKRFFVGLDLNGTGTFWEFRDTLSPGRMRRIVQYPRSLSIHYSDVTSRISPAWHQWLRHTRANPPSLEEQAADIQRQERLKILAATADRRWEAKGRYLDRPKDKKRPGEDVGLLTEQQAVSALRFTGGIGDSGGGRGLTGNESAEDSTWRMGRAGNATQTSDGEVHPFTRKDHASEAATGKREDPWKQTRGGLSEEWQPQAWDPNSLAARR